MALSHSRVKNVFYIEPDPRNGALGSKDEIHALSQLNHRYVFFRLLGLRCSTILYMCTIVYDSIENMESLFLRFNAFSGGFVVSNHEQMK